MEFDEQKWELQSGTPKKLTLKQRMMIVSRKDRMGNAKPTAKRLIIAICLLLLILIVANMVFSLFWTIQQEQGTEKGTDDIQLSFVGDICLGRHVGSYIENNGYNDLLKHTNELCTNSDLVFANLECAIVDDPQEYTEADKNIHISAASDALKQVAAHGIDVVSLANNHTMDYCGDALEYELNVLSQTDLIYAGAGNNDEEAAAYKLIETDGVKIGYVAFSDVIPADSAAHADTCGIATSSNQYLYQNIHEAAEASDLVVVYVHWGIENGVSVNDDQRQIAHQLIESGADIVIGSHPHILQNIEKYQDGIIFYSLGNYIFDQCTRETRNTAMVQVNFNKTTGNADFTVIPMRINNFAPETTNNYYYVKMIQGRLLKGLSADDYTISEDHRIHISMPLVNNEDTAK